MTSPESLAKSSDKSLAKSNDKSLAKSSDKSLIITDVIIKIRVRDVITKSFLRSIQ